MEGKEWKWALKERRGREDAGFARLTSGISKDRNVRVRHSDLNKTFWGVFDRPCGCVVVVKPENNMGTQLGRVVGAGLGFHDIEGVVEFLLERKPHVVSWTGGNLCCSARWAGWFIVWREGGHQGFLLQTAGQEYQSWVGSHPHCHFHWCPLTILPSPHTFPVLRAVLTMYTDS